MYNINIKIRPMVSLSLPVAIQNDQDDINSPTLLFKKRRLCVLSFSKQENKQRRRKKMKSFRSIRSIFMHADGVDLVLMGLGLIGAVGDGFITPIIYLIVGLLLNNIGGSSFGDKTFMHAIMKVFPVFFTLCSWSQFLARTSDDMCLYMYVTNLI